MHRERMRGIFLIDVEVSKFESDAAREGRLNEWPHTLQGSNQFPSSYLKNG